MDTDTNIDTDQDERIVELEIHVAQLESTTTELSDVINEQWKTIDKLTREMKNLKDFIKEAAGASNQAPGQEPPPPHY